MPPAERGFTLIEMMVVLAILGLLAGLIVLRAPRSGALDMREAAAMVAGTLRAARGQAIAHNRLVPVRSADGGTALQLGDAAIRRLPPAIHIAASPPIILFRPDGSSSGGAIQLAGGARTASIAVDWLTGRVTNTK